MTEDGWRREDPGEEGRGGGEPRLLAGRPGHRRAHRALGHTGSQGGQPVLSLPFWVPSAAALVSRLRVCPRGHPGRCRARGAGESVPRPLPDAARPSEQSPIRAISGRTISLTTHTFLLILTSPKPAPRPPPGSSPSKPPCAGLPQRRPGPSDPSCEAPAAPAPSPAGAQPCAAAPQPRPALHAEATGGAEPSRGLEGLSPACPSSREHPLRRGSLLQHFPYHPAFRASSWVSVGGGRPTLALVTLCILTAYPRTRAPPRQAGLPSAWSPWHLKRDDSKRLNERKEAGVGGGWTPRRGGAKAHR